MSENTNIASVSDMKNRVRNFFVTVGEDKFTQVDTVSLEQKIGWLLDAGFFLNLGIDYRRKDDVDSVFFILNYESIGIECLGMETTKIFMILDGDSRVELSEITSHRSKATPVETATTITTKCIESVELRVPMADMIAIANAKDIEFSMRFKNTTFDNKIEGWHLTRLKGFYNNVFDEDFELKFLYEEIPDLEKNKSSGCYIATMAYGSYDHPQVLVLRSFRDNVLAKSKFGRMFISYYYKHSPRLVGRLQGCNILNSLIRNALDLVVLVVGNRKR